MTGIYAFGNGNRNEFDPRVCQVFLKIEKSCTKNVISEIYADTATQADQGENFIARV